MSAAEMGRFLSTVGGTRIPGGIMVPLTIVLHCLPAVERS